MAVVINAAEVRSVQAAMVLKRILMIEGVIVRHVVYQTILQGCVSGVPKQRRLLKIAFFLDLYQALLYKGIYEWRQFYS